LPPLRGDLTLGGDEAWPTRSTTLLLSTVNEKEINMRQLWTRASRPEDHHRSRGRLKLWLVVGVAALAAVVTAGERPARVPWVT